MNFPYIFRSIGGRLSPPLRRVVGAALAGKRGRVLAGARQIVPIQPVTRSLARKRFSIRGYCQGESSRWYPRDAPPLPLEVSDGALSSAKSCFLEGEVRSVFFYELSLQDCFKRLSMYSDLLGTLEIMSLASLLMRT